MNKKVKNTEVLDSSEDIEIEKVAHQKGASQYILLFILIVLFGFTFFSCLYYIGDYYQNKNKIYDNSEVIEINNQDINAIITNNGEIDKKITEDLKDNQEIKIEKVNTIVLKTLEDSKEDGKINISIKYAITENSFESNMISKNDSDLLVRFSYSFDKENWTYLNNVISTSNTALNPLMGNFYDIAGLIDTLNVQTNYELKSSPGESVTMYWKCETIMSNIADNVDNNIVANFKIVY